MSSPAILWGAAGLAAVLPMIRLLLLNQQWVKPQLLNAVLSKCCYEGRWDRATKLCRAQLQLPYCAALDEVFQAINALPQDNGARTIITPLTSVFAEAYAVKGTRFFTMRWLSLLAVALLIIPPLHWNAMVRALPNLQTYLLLLGAAAILIGLAEYVAIWMRDTCAVSGTRLMAQLSNAASRTPEPTRDDAPKYSLAPPSRAPGAMRVLVHVYRRADFIEEHTFNKDVIRIGRVSTSDIGADESSLSRMHAVLELSPNGTAQIIDLGSSTGTFHRGLKVNKATLVEGDEVGVGDLRLVIRKLEPA